MSIFSSLYIGRSGLRVNETGFQVVGDNIANMNTVGYKSRRAVFADILNQTIIGTAGISELGQGSAVQAVQRLHTQGAMSQTGVTTDLAVGGNGMFIVEGQAAGGEGQFYTRNGQFRIDQDGFLVNADGMRVQGFPANQEGVLSTSLGDLKVGLQTSPPEASTEAILQVNLDPNEETVPAGATFDPTAPEETAAFSNSVEVFDSVGNAHQVDVYYVHEADGSWSWHAVTEGSELEGGTAGPTELGSGTVEFDENGNLVSGQTADVTAEFAGAAEQTVTLDFTGSTSVAKSGTSDASTVLFVDSDGRASGELAFLDVEEDGTIRGSFSNGDVRVLGRLALAQFQAPDKLSDIGENLYARAPGSGDPTIGVPNAGGRGQIFEGSLEQSNVDLTNEFNQMIIHQRGFQASSRTISTANAMLAELVNLGR
ncbi:MAG: flagellar hook protein FlgE [Myxococcota bacterium]